MNRRSFTYSLLTALLAGSAVTAVATAPTPVEAQGRGSRSFGADFNRRAARRQRRRGRRGMKRT